MKCRGGTPGVTKFGQRPLGAGYRVCLPSLFGRPGAPFGGREIRRSLRQVCVSRESLLLAGRPAGRVMAFFAARLRAWATRGPRPASRR
jgi:dienelactone hydrolase